MRELGLTPPTVSGELAYIDQERARGPASAAAIAALIPRRGRPETGG
ncbi:MAG TPA: hypothetical protein VMV17_14845 [Streptosporangiaceae bacterium]|nr:hypothetical protein [Streptosporangiaceae bacterium]